MSLIAIFIVFTLYTCIDPYKPKIDDFQSYLVVEASITDENTSYEVKLSKTMQYPDSASEKINGATIFVTDNGGNQAYFTNTGDGVYKSDSTSFRGIIGETYILHITTPDGKSYESEPSTMLPVTNIDSLYYQKEQQYINNQSKLETGLQLYLDSRTDAGTNNYFKWEYSETWKFKLPNIKKYNYINDSTFAPVTDMKVFCWKQQKSTDIYVQYEPTGSSGIMTGVPLNFIGSDLSDRLTIEYSILVKQYSISEKEYHFWDNLKKVNESGGDIFGSQPYPVLSNISNTDNPDENVLGYFSVSAVTQKRIFISFSELTKLNLPYYHYPCKRYETKPSDYAWGWSAPPTWDELYSGWINSGYVFIEPYMNPVTGELQTLVFAKPECSDCELTGTIKRPDFWIDL